MKTTEQFCHTDGVNDNCVWIGNKFQVSPIRVKSICDESPDLSYLTDETRYEGCTAEEIATYVEQDKARLADYGNGWNCIGIKAFITVYVPIGYGSYRRQEFSSGGLWGIESDSDRSYLQSVAQDEIADLREHVKTFGIDLPANLEIESELD